MILLLFLLIVTQTALALGAGYGAAKLRSQSAALHYSKSSSFSMGRGGVRMQSATRYSNAEVQRAAHKRRTPSGAVTNVAPHRTTVKKKVTR